MVKHTQSTQIKSKTATCSKDVPCKDSSASTTLAQPMCSPTYACEKGNKKSTHSQSKNKQRTTNLSKGEEFVRCTQSASTHATYSKGDDGLSLGNSLSSPAGVYQPKCSPGQQLASPQASYPHGHYPSPTNAYCPSPLYTPRRVTASAQPTSLFSSQQ